MSMLSSQTLVSAAWLRERYADGIRILDATYHLPTEGRDAGREFVAEHIPGARFFDINVVCDRSSALPHMLPSAEEFESAVGALGIGSGDAVVVYDTNNFSAPRAWWMFRAFGHRDVAVLDGGFPAWRAAGGDIERGEPPACEARRFEARLEPERVVEKTGLRRIVDQRTHRILDARGAARFAGEAPEPRAGLRSGHIPTSVNVPYGELLTAEGKFRSPGDIRKRFLNAGVDDQLPVITTCGSGVTACVLALGLELAELGPARVYDGSWAEWGADDSAPLETGPAFLTSR